MNNLCPISQEFLLISWRLLPQQNQEELVLTMARSQAEAGNLQEALALAQTAIRQLQQLSINLAGELAEKNAMIQSRNATIEAMAAEAARWEVLE